MAKAVKSKQKRTAKQQGQARPAGRRPDAKEAKEPAKAPSRWSRARTRAKQTPVARNAARPPAKGEKRGLRRFLKDVRVEMAKVTWPTRKDLLQSTIVVIVAVVIAGMFTGALDFVFSRIVDFLLKAIGA